MSEHSDADFDPFADPEPAHTAGPEQPGSPQLPPLRRLGGDGPVQLPLSSSPFEPLPPYAPAPTPASGPATAPSLRKPKLAGLAAGVKAGVRLPRRAPRATQAGDTTPPAMPAWQPPSPATGQPRTGPSASLAGSRLVRVVAWVLLALAFTVVIRTFALEPFKVPSGSMQGTLQPGDRMLVEKVSYRAGPPRRGDVVVFDGTGSFDAPGTPGKLYVKRVIGVAGDVVACCDERGRVLVNGAPQWEPYVFEDDRLAFAKVTVPPGYVWVMGDHRRVSGDSRFYGPVPVDHVVGRAVVKVWPVTRVGTLPRS